MIPARNSTARVADHVKFLGPYSQVDLGGQCSGSVRETHDQFNTGKSCYLPFEEKLSFVILGAGNQGRSGLEQAGLRIALRRWSANTVVGKALLLQLLGAVNIASVEHHSLLQQLF